MAAIIAEALVRDNLDFKVHSIKVDSQAPCKRTQLCSPTTANIVGCYMLRLFAHPVACCWMLLRVVEQRLKPVKLFSQQLPTFLYFRDRRSVASATMLDPFSQLFQHCWPRTLITHGLQRLMGCILPTMHCRSQDCWELLHPFAHHCQHARNNSQHCWRNNVGSCCVRLHAALVALVAASISYFLTAATKLPCCSSNKKTSPLLFISPSRFSFSCAGLPPTFSFSLSFSSKGAHAWSSAKMAIAKKI